MDGTSPEFNSAKRKRGRPRKYTDSTAKAAADVDRRRASRQQASSGRRNETLASFYQSTLREHSDAGVGWVNISSDIYAPTNLPDAQAPDERDISQFLSAADSPADSVPEEDLGEQPASDDENPEDLAAPGHAHNHDCPDLQNSTDVVLDAPPEPGSDKPDLHGRLAKKLAEQLLKFNGCCDDCHQAGGRSRVGGPSARISLATYLESTTD